MKEKLNAIIKKLDKEHETKMDEFWEKFNSGEYDHAEARQTLGYCEALRFATKLLIECLTNEK